MEQRCPATLGHRITQLKKTAVQDVFWVLSRITPLAILDVLLVTIVVYALLTLIQGTQADQLVRGILILFLASIVLDYFFPLAIFSGLLENSLPALIIAIPVIFQPEIRRALEQLGRTGTLIRYPFTAHPGGSPEKAINDIIDACIRLSERQHGALIVLERSTGLEEYVEAGSHLDAELSSELLVQTFYPRTPLHDGAAVIRNDRLLAARVLLPLSERVDLDPGLGTRHRAAIGITEQSDAVCIVVSEESGAISIAVNGHLSRDLTTGRLRRLLQAQLLPQGLSTPWRPVRAP